MSIALSWQWPCSDCRSSLGPDSARVHAAEPQTKSVDSVCECAYRLLMSASAIAIYYRYSARKLLVLILPFHRKRTAESTNGRSPYVHGERRSSGLPDHSQTDYHQITVVMRVKWSIYGDQNRRQLEIRRKAQREPARPRLLYNVTYNDTLCEWLHNCALSVRRLAS